jgi:hypothetical protein
MNKSHGGIERRKDTESGREDIHFCRRIRRKFEFLGARIHTFDFMKDVIQKKKKIYILPCV